MENAEITELKVKPGHVITVKENGGILAGRAETFSDPERDSKRYIEDYRYSRWSYCGCPGRLCGGKLYFRPCGYRYGKRKGDLCRGIAGRAAESLIVDCEVNTGDSLSARIQGGGYVGGIVGFQNSADIFNTHVMGTIGGSGSQSIGGITGKYASGKMKVARFEGPSHLPGLEVRRARELLLELMILAFTSVMGLRTERMWRTCSRIQRRRSQPVSAAQVSRMTIGSPTMPILASGTKGDNFYIGAGTEHEERGRTLFL